MASKRNHYSGIGGQAVLEGIMMKNGDKYAIAVRKSDGKIIVEQDNYQGLLDGSLIKKIPFIRGIFNFIDSLMLGMKCLNYSASVEEYDMDDKSSAGNDKNNAKNRNSTGNDKSNAKDGGNSAGNDRSNAKDDENDVGNGRNNIGDRVMTALVTCVSFVLAIGIFVVLPYYIASKLNGYVRNQSLIAIVEGAVRIVIFIIYVCAISLMKDIRRLYRYHGAEHKCINCIERGRPLTVKNVMRSSRLHRRCGTSFIFFVLFVSIVLFFFIRVDHVVMRVALRILLMPVVAGISYEIIRLAGRSDNILVRIISAPGMAVQRLTTKEPDEEMAEVAIAAVESVFDWRKYLQDNFGYRAEELEAATEK